MTGKPTQLYMYCKVTGGHRKGEFSNLRNLKQKHNLFVKHLNHQKTVHIDARHMCDQNCTQYFQEVFQLHITFF